MAQVRNPEGHYKKRATAGFDTPPKNKRLHPRQPGGAAFGILLLFLLSISCSPGSAVRATAVKSASLDFRFSPGHDLAGLELHLAGPDGTALMTISMARDGRLWSGRLSDSQPAANPFHWSQAGDAAEGEEDDGSSPDQGSEFQAPDLEQAENPDSPAPDLPAGFLDLPLLGRISSDGQGDGWQKGTGGSPLVLKRSALQDLAGMELVLMEGSCKIINISWKELGGKQRMALSLLEPGYVELAPLVSGMTATDEALVLEINGGDGIYGTDSGVVEVRGISRELAAAGWQETRSADAGEGEESLPVSGTPLPLPADAWHTVTLGAGEKILSLKIDGTEISTFDLGGKTWTGLEVLAQNLPGVQWRNLKVQ